MIGHAQATIQIKDLWSSKASSIAKSTDKMEKAISNFEKRFGKLFSVIKNFDVIESGTCITIDPTC